MAPLLRILVFLLAALPAMPAATLAAPPSAEPGIVQLLDAAPDLVVPDITWSPAAPGVGANVTFTATVRNQGNASAGNFSVGFHVDGGGVIFHRDVSGLGAGASVNLTAGPWLANATGNHSIMVAADIFDDIAELNETNNQREESVPVSGSGLPDLTLRSAPLPSELHEGVPVGIGFSEVNLGNGTAGPHALHMLVDGVPYQQVALDPLGPFASRGLTVTWVVQAGRHVIDLVTDALGNVTESNEGNNQLRIDVVSGPMPDLIVWDLRLDPPDPEPGQAAAVVVGVLNFGNAPAEASTLVLTVYGGGSGSPELFPTPALAPGASAEFRSRTFTAQAGRWQAYAYADVFQVVPERDERNDRVAYLPIGRPDFAVVDIRLEDPDVAPGEFTAVVFRFRNEGDLDGQALLEWTLDGARGASYAYLAPGQERVERRTFYATGGAHEASAQALDLYERRERDLHDNHGALHFRVLVPDPAIAAEDIVITKRLLETDATPGLPNPVGGQDIHVRLRNLGEGRTWNGGYEVALRICAEEGPLSGPPFFGAACSHVADWDLTDPLPTGGQLDLSSLWDHDLALGDFQVCVEIYYVREQMRQDNDEACRRTFVVVGGTGLGGFDP